MVVVVAVLASLRGRRPRIGGRRLAGGRPRPVDEQVGLDRFYESVSAGIDGKKLRRGQIKVLKVARKGSFGFRLFSEHYSPEPQRLHVKLT
jgi:hypothetical protein